MLKERKRVRLVFSALSESLNPYFNGTCSKSPYLDMVEDEGIIHVLILILMEHAQRVRVSTWSKTKESS